MGVAIATLKQQRVLTIPAWSAKPPAPVFVIAAAAQESTTTGPVTREEVEVFYPGEGFEGVSLPDCMINRVQRTRTTLMWVADHDRGVSLVGVDTAQPTNPRPQTLITSGVYVADWQSVSYSPTALVPPLDNNGLIPDCGGYVDEYAHTTSQVSGLDNRPVVANLDPTPWQTEAERVRDHFPWHRYQCPLSAQGEFLVRAVPLTPETLQDYVYPHDTGQVYNGLCGMDGDYLWVPPAGQGVDDTPWRQEMETWRQEVDWLAVVAQRSGVPGELLTQWGTLNVTPATAGTPPTWQVGITWNGLPGALAAVGFATLAFTFANSAESRLVAILPQPDGGWQETRQLLHRANHPLTGTASEEVILTGHRTLSGDQTTYHPNWKVEAYEAITP